MRDGQTSPHKPRLVVPHSTCPSLSPSPPAHSFIIGPAVINTHTLCTLSRNGSRESVDDRPFIVLTETKSSSKVQLYGSRFPSWSGSSLRACRSALLLPDRVTCSKDAGLRSGGSLGQDTSDRGRVSEV